MKEKIEPLCRRIPKWLTKLFCVYLLGTFLMLLVIDKRIQYYYYNFANWPNWVLLFAVGILFCGAIWSIVYYHCGVYSQLRNKKFFLFLGFYFLGLLLLQLLIAKSIYFKTDWDVGVVTNNAENIAFHGASGVNSYYNTYPNNLVLTYTLVFLFKLGALIHQSNSYIFLVVFCCLMVNLSVLLSVLCVLKITKNKTVTIISTIIGTILIGLSLWMVIPYSDAFGILFPVLTVFLFLYIPNQPLRYFLTFFAGFVRYLYKPTIIIVLIALCIIKTFQCLSSFTQKKLDVKQLSVILLSIVLAALCAFGWKTAFTFQNQTELDENKQMTITHYLMMGLNYDRNGTYFDEDLLFSASLPDVASREKANLEVAKQRLKDLGVKGYMKLLIKKNMYNYNDGTFGGAEEGTFYKTAPEADSKADAFWRSIYCSNDETNHYEIYATIEQGVWLLVLLCGVCCILPKKTKGDGESLIALTLLGASIFLLLFECSARYLFIFSPLFVTFAGIGLWKASLFLEDMLQKRRQKRLLTEG